MQLPKEAKIISNIIEKHGGLSKEQAAYILIYGCGKSEYAVKAILEGMVIKKQVSLVADNFYVPYALQSINREKIILLWVAINEIINNALERSEAAGKPYDYSSIMDNLNTLCEGTGAYDMTFLENNSIFDLTYMTSDSLHKATFLDRTATKVKPNKGGDYVYVASELFVFESTDKDAAILETLKTSGFEVPYDVYFVNMKEGLSGMPDLNLQRISAMRHD